MNFLVELNIILKMCPTIFKYLFVLIFILLVNVVIGTVFLIYSGKITTEVFNEIETTFVTDYSNDDDVQSIFDFIQSEVNF